MRVVSVPHLAKYRYKGRPAWMFFRWLPLRGMRARLVAAGRRAWMKKAGNKQQVMNPSFYKMKGGPFMVCPMTYKHLQNTVPLDEETILR